jgi:hypothetical protein
LKVHKQQGGRRLDRDQSERLRVIRRFDETHVGSERRERAFQRGAHQGVVVGDRDADSGGGFHDTSGNAPFV